ncbi:MAG: formylmethanofuran--tetrahydromethanopterin N-formyltransferase [Anaerolineales bacterium]|nr:formylmethanofuran--tetrahydromethanopterin N-formyltransferase [Anaerolineales bacterium]
MTHTLPNGTRVDDTFAEAFGMWGARAIITAETAEWASAAAQTVTGFATSIIGCRVEAGVEADLAATATPDGRPGVSVLFFTVRQEDLRDRLVERIGQCVLTTATTACYDGLPDASERLNIGGPLRYFGDGYQISKQLAGRRYWRIPVMEGEFVVEEHFGAQRAVGGGNLLLMAGDAATTRRAAEAAVAAMRTVPKVITSFTRGIVRSGSQVGSRYRFLRASTNSAFCPTLRGVAPNSQVPEGVGSVLEIVLDGLDLAAVTEGMRRGLRAAAANGATHISAGNYGGRLGQFQVRLHSLLEETA